MDNIFQNIGLFLCVGGLIVVALVAFGVSSMMRRARAATQDPIQQNQEPTVLNQRGHERPTYDSQRVESRGGIGGNVDTDAGTNRPIPQTGRRGGGFGNARQFDNDPQTDNRKRANNDDDDDNIRSSGGFGR